MENPGIKRPKERPRGAGRKPGAWAEVGGLRAEVFKVIGDLGPSLSRERWGVGSTERGLASRKPGSRGRGDSGVGTMSVAVREEVCWGRGLHPRRGKE